jgi:hypothetical protein
MNKKLITSLPAGGVGFNNEDFLLVQNEIREEVGAILEGLDTAMVVKGCNTSVSGGNVTIQSGVVFVDKQIMYFGGYTGTYPVYVKAGVEQREQRLFKDGFSKDKYVTVQAMAQTTVPLSGGYITFNPTPNKVFKDLITASESSARATAVTNLQNNLNTEITARTNADTNLQNSVNALSAGKLDAAFNSGWTEITPYNAGASLSNASSYWNLAYRRDARGQVFFRGNIRLAANFSGVAFRLSGSYTPTRNAILRVHDLSLNPYHAIVVIALNTSTGVCDVSISANNVASAEFSFDGQSYWI